jgi:SAM-dependent methyltransferase
VLPRHPAEIDRLDVQHYALQEALGANYLAPIQRPALILDAGAGTGQWAFDLCEEFPDATVIGLDVVPSKPRPVDNYRFIRGNLLQGLPFSSARFDFVHQRLLFGGIPVKSWSTVVADLVRVTRPGGWVELVEAATRPERAGPATDRLAGMLERLSRASGIDSTGIIYRSLDGYLLRAGVTGVTRHAVELPVGEWGGKVGSLMASDGRALFTRLAGIFQARFGIPMHECLDLIVTAQQEWEQHHTTYGVVVAFGRKR